MLDALARRAATLAVAESLTGGMVGERITTVPGASAAFRGGVIAYATDVKNAVLGVDGHLLDSEGAVHPEVASQLATGVRRLLGATYGLALTGVAGPDPQDGRPVGTLFVAVAGPDDVRVESPVLPASGRAETRERATTEALRLLLDVVG